MSKFPVCVLIIILILSCTSNPASISRSSQSEPLPYKPLSEIPGAHVIGTIQANFLSIFNDSIHIKNINEAAYIELMETAGREYPGNIDVRDISWSFIGWNSTRHLNEYRAIGRVIQLGENTHQNSIADTKAIEQAVAKAAIQATENVPKISRIAIVYITAEENNIADYITGELEYIWIKSGYTIIDRRQLDTLRNEQNFQMSGEVDDATAVSIGNIIGANIIVTGSVDGEGELRRLRLRVLDIKTSQVVGVASEPM